MPLYVYPGTWAAMAVETLQASSPEEAPLAQKIAVVVLEPDSLQQLDTCLSEPDQAQRLELLRSFCC